MLCNCRIVGFRLFLVFVTLTITSSLVGQSILQKRLDFKISNSSISNALLSLSEQADFPIIFSSKLVSTKQRCTVDLKGKTVREIIDAILQSTGVSVKESNGRLILFKTPPRRYTISGYVQDAKSGEGLVSANVWEAASGRGVSTNDYGFFSLSLEEGAVELHFSYLGYEKAIKSLRLNAAQQLKVKLTPSLTLREVVVLDDRSRESFRRYLPGRGIGINAAEVEEVPTLVGESDLFRFLQLQGDVQTGSDGIGGLHVRGGNTDQNLILLDGVPVYNPSHTLGLFSIFNTNTIKSVRFVKDDFSAKYGGRLSSVIDVRTKEGNTEAFSFQGEVGVLASKVLLEGPILGKKGGFLLAARRTHIDPLITSISRRQKRRFDDEGETNYAFHDITAKTHLNLSRNDRLFLSFYHGADAYRDRTDWNLSFEDTSLVSRFRQKISWGNTIGSLRWNHTFGQQLFSNTTLTLSEYRYKSQNIGFFEERTPDSLYQSNLYTGFASKINDAALKTDFEYFPSEKHHILFGGGITFRNFRPGSIEEENNELIGDNIDQLNDDLGLFSFSDSIPTQELDLYIEDKIKLSQKVNLSVGLHAATFFSTNKDYFSLQPRLGLSFQTAKGYTTLLSFSRMTQFLHLLTTSGSGFPNDLWVPSTAAVKPQHAWQVSLAESYIFDENWSGKVDIYYKKMTQLINYREGASLPSLSEPNPIFWEEDITTGEGWSYGTSLQLQYKEEQFSAWLSAAAAVSERQFAEVNNGERYPYRYQHPFSFNLQMTRYLSEKVSLSLGWDYGSGQPITLLVSNYPFVPLDNLSAGPTERIGVVNGFRMPAYHRLDIAMVIDWGKQRWKHQLNLGIYNVYNRANTYYQYWLDDLYYPEDNGLQSQPALPILPSMSYKLSF